MLVYKGEHHKKASLAPCSEPPFSAWEQEDAVLGKCRRDQDGRPLERTVSLGRVCGVSCTTDPSGEVSGPILRIILSDA